MVHAVWPLLAATTKSAPVHITAVQWVFVALAFAVGVVLAELRRWARGTYPWRLHSVIWGLFLVVTGGLAVLLLILAWFTTKPRAYDPPPRRGAGAGGSGGAGASGVTGPGGRPLSPIAEWVALRRGRRSRVPGAGAGGLGGEGPPSGVVPGTYGTSLPPHEPPPPPPPGEPAGWLADPTGRHEHRYWDGSSWSRHVADGGRRSVDDP